mgnify:CR=1 FL=1
MTTNEKLAALRRYMKEAGVNAYLVPSSDPHMSEYLPEHWKVRAYLSGFDGSAGTLVVTEEKSALWTDGSYFIQAGRQLYGSEIQLLRLDVEGTPGVETFLRDNLPDGGRIGVEYMTLATATAKNLDDENGEKGLRTLDLPLPADLWPDRPPVPKTEIWALAPDQTGKSAWEQIDALRGNLADQGCDAMMVCRLDDLAWLTNLRGADVATTPVSLGTCGWNPQGRFCLRTWSACPRKFVPIWKGKALRWRGTTKSFPLWLVCRKSLPACWIEKEAITLCARLWKGTKTFSSWRAQLRSS